MTAYRRGFKTESATIVDEVRAEVRVGPIDPLDPLIIADLYGVPVKTVAELGSTLRTPADFSAVTVFRQSRRIIVLNDDHAPTRRRNSLAHELAHLLLEHKPIEHFADHEREWDPGIEREADWLGAEMLIPRRACLAILEAGEPPSAAAKRFGVSEQLITMRLNVSGARSQFDRRRR